MEDKTQETAAKTKEPKGYYDVVSGSNGATGSGNKRRKARIETKEETGKGGILKPKNRLEALNLCRDAERNFSNMRSILHQFKVNVIGPSPKCQVNTDDDFGKAATKWFNKKWSKNCDFRSQRRFAKMAQLVVAARQREGDLLVVFDNGQFKDSGKIMFYEADQICDLAEENHLKSKGYTQEDGVVFDKWGREVGYVVSNGARGKTSVNKAEATIFSRDPDSEELDSVKMIRSDFRLIQPRGVAPLLTCVNDAIDCYEMRAKELQTAKVAASLAGTIKRSEAVTDYDDPRLDPDNDNPADQEPGYEGTENTLPEEQTEPANYENLESLTGGYFDYLDEDDEFTLHDVSRPNVNMAAFVDYVLDGAGSGMGLAHAYTRLKADTSYTAFRGDMVLSWVTFYAEQKDIEHDFLDWAAVHAIQWAIDKGIITETPPEDWQDKISWTLPRMPFVDASKERDANAKGLKNGEIDFATLLGPEWEEKFEAFAKQLDKARELNLPLSPLEQKSGGMATTEEPAETESGNNGDNEDV